MQISCDAAHYHIGHKRFDFRVARPLHTLLLKNFSFFIEYSSIFTHISQFYASALVTYFVLYLWSIGCAAPFQLMLFYYKNLHVHSKQQTREEAPPTFVSHH